MQGPPYLNGIKVFEAAARGGGFTAASRELNITPAAISRMVRLLEDRLGVALFERRANGLELTAAGRLYQSGLTPLFSALTQLTEQVAGMGAAQTLTVGVGPTFAIRWLIPRLADFRREAPTVDVRITTGGAAAPFAEAWTCGIQLGRGPDPGLAGELLFTADLLPVCRPEVAASLRAPEDLSRTTLLRVAHAPEDWPSWLAAAGLHGIEARGPVLEFYGQALQAALDGVGVALGIRPYIDDDLASGRLVAPFSLIVPKGMGWFLIFREARRREPAFVAFRDWISLAARGSGATIRRYSAVASG
jgi:LysR family transcriptional regulator, glycine cleavage system transcriptional activator